MGNAAAAPLPDSIPQSTPPAVDISGMPDPPDDLIGTAQNQSAVAPPAPAPTGPAAAPAAPDISGMPAPADLFKQQYGRAPKSPAELQTFTSGTRDLKAGAMDPLLGLGELGASAVSGLAGQVGGFLAHVGTLLVTQDPAGAKAVRDAVQNALTYQPKYSTTGPAMEQATSAVMKAAWNAAHGPQAKAAVDNAMRAHFGDSATDSIEAGVGMAGEAAQAVATVAGAGGIARGAAEGAVGNIDVNPHIAPQAADIRAATQPNHAPRVAALAAATPPVAANEARPVTGEDLKKQPDPLQPPPAKAAPPAAETPPPAAPPEAGAPQAAPTAAPEAPAPEATTPAAPAPGPDLAPQAPAPGPGLAEAQKPRERFIPPQEEGTQRGALEQGHQDARTSTLQDLNDISGGALPEVRHSAVTGDYGETGTDFQHSRMNDAGGQRMQGVIAGENDALKSGARAITEGTGTTAAGVDQGALTERGTVIDRALGGIQKWFDNPNPQEGEQPGLIQRLYKAANDRAQGTPIQRFNNLQGILGDQTEFMGTAEGEALHRGAMARAQKLGLIGDQGAWQPATVEQAERFRQWLGDQWTPRTAKMIGKTRDALDSDVAQHAGADLYNQARAARTMKSKMLDEQPGIAALAQPRDRAGINREVPIANIPDHIANLDRDQFNHVVNVLKSSAHLGNGELADNAAAALNEIKGHMAARMEDAGGKSLDGNWNAKDFYRQADKYSQKLPAIFNPEERRRIQVINRAGNVLRMDKRYPGAAAQLHNTGIAGSIRESAAKAARGATAVASHHILPVVGPILEEGTGLGAKVEKLVGGDPEKRRLATVEKRIDQLPPRGEPPEGGAPAGARIGGGKQRGAVGVLNNASGESSASLEAQSRVAQERANGHHRYQIDPDGNVTPLRGVDAVDARAPQGSITVQRGVGSQPYSILDRGGLPASHANGLLARAGGNLADAERANRSPTIIRGALHGTDSHFENFDPDLLGSASGTSDSAHGFWFTHDPVRAAQARRDAMTASGVNIAPPPMVRDLHFQNPKVVHTPLREMDPPDSARILKAAKKAGHDGVIFTHGEGATPDYVALDTKAIKTPDTRTLGQRIGGARQRGGPKASDFTTKRLKDNEPLRGMPQESNVNGFEYKFGPNMTARHAAEDYAEKAGINYQPVNHFRYLDQATGKKVADAYDAMKDDPTDPKVAASYKALADETRAQYDGIMKTGLNVEFHKPGMSDPYAASPRLGNIDVNRNNHLWVFPTDNGFGTLSDAQKAHPMLQDSGRVLDGKHLTNNDLFRVVHDYYGHIAEGNGFRAQGEYNAWRLHSRLYSPQAQGALASETLGQNAWVNFGPHAEANKGASGAATVYADQKAGLMPASIYGGDKGSLAAEHDTAPHPGSGPGFAAVAKQLYGKLDKSGQNAVDLIHAQMRQNGPNAGKETFEHLLSKNNWTTKQATDIEMAAKTKYFGEGEGTVAADNPTAAAQPAANVHPAVSNLTDAERGQLRSDTTKRLIDTFDNLPPTKEYAAAALAGQAKKGWYQQSAKAIANVFGPDAPRFSALLAAMSPQTSIQNNFHNALRTFVNWDKAGRPTDAKSIVKIMSDSSQRGPETPGQGNVLPAWKPNAIAALSSDTPEKVALSGPKVHSFYQNLIDNVHEVTNDAWMAAFSKIDPRHLGGKLNAAGPGKSSTYLALSAKVRDAAKLLSKMTGEAWTPREVQETVWSWAKTAYEHANTLGDKTIPELVKHGHINDQLIRSTPDFHQLFAQPEHAGFLGRSRFAGHVERVSGPEGEGTESAGAGEAGTPAGGGNQTPIQAGLNKHLQNAAKRLESIRQERKGSAADDEVPF